MLETRVIPSLLLKNGGLVKTIKFNDPKYVGDPINAVKIFNEKEVDELVILDIDATKTGKGPDFRLLARIAREAFMPMGYGGGIKTLEDVRSVLSLGYEKVIINSKAIEDISFISRAADECGSQSIVVCIDVKRDIFGRPYIYNYIRGKSTGLKPDEWASRCVRAGAGELIVYSVDREGTFNGYDIELLKQVASSVNVPVVALGGAGCIDDLIEAINQGHASAVAAGSFFVFQMPHRAVLISYPKKEIENIFQATKRICSNDIALELNE